MENIPSFTIISVSISLILLFAEVFFYHKKLVFNCGITIYREKYNTKNNILKKNIGKYYKLVDTDFKIIEENICIFSSYTNSIIESRSKPLIYGCCIYVDGVMIIIYKKPFSYLLVFIVTVANLIIFQKEMLLIFSVIIILIISFVSALNYFKFTAMRYDIEHFLSSDEV